MEIQSFRLLQSHANEEMLVTDLIPLMIRIIKFDNQEHTILERSLLAMRNMYLLTNMSSLSSNGLSLFTKLSFDPESFHCQVRETAVTYSFLTFNEIPQPIEDYITSDCYPLFAYHIKEHFPFYQWVLKQGYKGELRFINDDQAWLMSKVVQILHYVSYLIDDLIEDIITVRDHINIQTLLCILHSDVECTAHQFTIKADLIQNIDILLKLYSKFE
jgi:hypothetical protein